MAPFPHPAHEVLSVERDTGGGRHRNGTPVNALLSGAKSTNEGRHARLDPELPTNAQPRAAERRETFGAADLDDLLGDSSDLLGDPAASFDTPIEDDRRLAAPSEWEDRDPRTRTQQWDDADVDVPAGSSVDGDGLTFDEDLLPDDLVPAATLPSRNARDARGAWWRDEDEDDVGLDVLPWIGGPSEAVEHAPPTVSPRRTFAALLTVTAVGVVAAFAAPFAVGGHGFWGSIGEGMRTIGRIVTGQREGDAPASDHGSPHRETPDRQPSNDRSRYEREGAPVSMPAIHASREGGRIVVDHDALERAIDFLRVRSEPNRETARPTSASAVALPHQPSMTASVPTQRTVTIEF